VAAGASGVPAKARAAMVACRDERRVSAPLPAIPVIPVIPAPVMIVTAIDAATVMRRLGDRVRWVCTTNEANTLLQVKANAAELLSNRRCQARVFVTQGCTRDIPWGDSGNAHATLAVCC
jgi:hypothetical protein